MKKYDFLVCHYHRVDSLTWLRIREVLGKLLLARVEAASECFTFSCSHDDCETILDFREQMDIGYLHPRRDSYHVSALSSVYSHMKIPASLTAAKYRQGKTIACPSVEEKPKCLSKVSDKGFGLSQLAISLAVIAVLFLISSHLDYLFNLC